MLFIDKLFVTSLLNLTQVSIWPASVKLHLHCNELTERMRNELQKMVIARQSECWTDIGDYKTEG